MPARLAYRVSAHADGDSAECAHVAKVASRKCKREAVCLALNILGELNDFEN